PGQDHDEVVGTVALTKQHLPGPRRPLLTVAAKQRDLLAIQRRGQERVCPPIWPRHPSPFLTLSVITLARFKATDISPAASLPGSCQSECFGLPQTNRRSTMPSRSSSLHLQLAC